MDEKNEMLSCLTCRKELTAEQVEYAVYSIIERLDDLPDETRNDPRLQGLLEAVSELIDASSVDGGNMCEHCMGCLSVPSGFRILPADKIQALVRGEAIEFQVGMTRLNAPPPYQIGEVVGVLETWGQGWSHEEIFYNDAEGYSRSRLEWVELPHDDNDPDMPPAIWYYADGDPPNDDGDFDWDKRPAVELPPKAIRTWFCVIAIERQRNDHFIGDWLVRCVPTIAIQETQ